MSTIKQAGILLCLGLALLSASDASALKAEKRAKVRKQIEKVRTWEMTRDLELSEGQARSLFPVRDQYRTEEREFKEERKRIEEELDSLVTLRQDPASEKEILHRLERLKLLDRQKSTRRVEYQQKLGRILDTRQQARYELFEKKFDRRLRKMIQDVRKESVRKPHRISQDSLRNRKPADSKDRKKPSKTIRKNEKKKKKSSDESTRRKSRGS
ncbi:MAG: hypothetical protein QF492_06170 [Candidatus Krumholzibacteria bacterium]|jgi:hypothetical protein|nr:hypothetical protein [Candidatus Krumholzibacteria bacterium]MDP6669473.1 hypothetical protein [Candidatus Krumholzibacteria bacterium]MDP6797872.1 hypothetical protein [Candidatus Krumholzibacteria bacterium]MDP7021132.1 hypothetical protein [Candidatus Krumholzibacteria bacterium]